jgi:ubiquinone biosynthesis protein
VSDMNPQMSAVDRLPAVSSVALIWRALALGARLAGAASIVGPVWVVERSRFGGVEAQARLARRAVRYVEGFGATYVKFAQMLASRSDLLPAHVVAELAALFDDVTPMTDGQLTAQWERVLRSQPALRALTLTGRCLGSGSIACVYEAVEADTDGPRMRRLAVKLQRPGVAGTMAKDLRLMTTMTALAEKMPAAGGAPLADLVGFMNDALYGQVDFLREAAHTELLAKNLVDIRGVIVPTVRQDLSGAEVLVTEFIDGLVDTGPLAMAAEERVRATTLALTAVGRMIFHDGFVHCDLHPGNLYVRADGSVVILDAGYCVEIPDEVRNHLAEFFSHLLGGDGVRCGEIMFDSALNARTGRDRAGFVADIARLVADNSGEGARFDMAVFGQGVFEIQNRHGIHPPSDFAFPLISLMITEGTLRQFWPDLQMPTAAAEL